MSLRIYNEMTIDSTYAGNSVWLSTDLALTQNQNERYLHSLGILGPPWVSLPKIRLTSTAFGRKYWITLRLYICITLNYHFAKCFWWLTHSTSGQQSLTANILWVLRETSIELSHDTISPYDCNPAVIWNFQNAIHWRSINIQHIITLTFGAEGRGGSAPPFFHFNKVGGALAPPAPPQFRRLWVLYIFKETIIHFHTPVTVGQACSKVIFRCSYPLGQQMFFSQVHIKVRRAIKKYANMGS